MSRKLQSLFIQDQNPHLRCIRGSWEAGIFEFIRDIAKESSSPLRLLDVGGEKVRPFGMRVANIPGIVYESLNIKKEVPYAIEGDICKHNPHIPDNSYDFVISKDVFEHILEPWNAALEMKRIVKEEGYIIVAAPFSWRYHPSPFDTFRYSHTGLRYLFEKYGGVRCIVAGYHKTGPIRGFWETKEDHPIGGGVFKDSIETIYVSQKRESVSFDISSLDIRKWDGRKKCLS